MKQNAIIRICIYSLVLILLLGLLMVSLSGIRRSRHAQFAPQAADGFTNDTSFAPSEVRKLDIDWAAGSILIEKADIDTIHISEQSVGDLKPMAVTLKDGALNIDFTQQSLIHISGTPTKNLTITVPRTWECQDLELDVASSTVTIQDLTIDQLELDGADGNLDLKNCDIRLLDVDCAAGKVNFSGRLHHLDMDGASAAFVGTFETSPARLTMDGMSGSLDVTLPKDTGFTARLEGLSCTFTSDFPVRSQNSTYTYGDGQCQIQADGMSVDVTVRFAE